MSLTLSLTGKSITIIKIDIINDIIIVRTNQEVVMTDIIIDIDIVIVIGIDIDIDGATGDKK